MSALPLISIIVVSYNTCALLECCLQAIYSSLSGLEGEVLVIDNASTDESTHMVAAKFPNIILIKSVINLGFAAANNVGFRQARGKYCVLVNSDAFLEPLTLIEVVKRMEANPQIGLGGVRQIGQDHSFQPSARLFPSFKIDFLRLSGLASRYAYSKFFGQADRTWANPVETTETDWVTGAFAIIRSDLLRTIGPFDERFFLYFEEVDLCKRFKAAGYQMICWGDLTIVHLGGESAKHHASLFFSKNGAQLTLWRMRSQLYYYRKHHGYLGAWSSKMLEMSWQRVRYLKNFWQQGVSQQDKAKEAARLMELMQQAWQETQGGQTTPITPW